MFTLRNAVLSVTAVAWLGLSAIAQSQSSAPAGGEVPASGPAPAPDGWQTAVLFDPAVGVNAYTLQFPPQWRYQAVVWQSSPCAPISAAVFRVSSPDGLSVVERMPPIGWAWGSTYESSRPQPGCLDAQRTIKAQEFLKYMSSNLQVEYVGDDTVPKEESDQYQANYDRLNANADRLAESGAAAPTHQWGDVAVARIRFRNGTYAMEGRLSTSIDCIGSRTRNFRGQLVEHDRCQATVRYLYAPEGKFASLWADQKRIGVKPVPGYLAAWTAALQRRQQQQQQQQQQQIAAMNAASQATMAASQRNFQNQQAAQLQAHNQFLATMQAGTDASMQRAAQIANTQHTITSDYVDYALGQQTFRNTATGQSTKVAAGAGVTWLSADGSQSYQASDPNANPNGVLPGTWNRGQQTHGDGSPY